MRRSAAARVAAAAALLPFVLVALGCLRGRVPTADLVLVHGDVITGRADGARAQAIAVRGGRFLEVGDDAAILRHRGAATPVVDLKGATVAPGFVDAGAEPLALGEALVNDASGGSLYLDLSDAETEEDAVQRVRARARGLKPGEWILGRGWDAERWPGRRMPDKRLLSDIVPYNPVALAAPGGHALWVNKKALDLAGIGARTPDPPGGRILRLPRSAEPSGILLERAAEPVLRLVPKPSPEERAAAIVQALRALAAGGVTLVGARAALDDLGVVDLGAEGEEAADLYRALASTGRLPIRVALLVPGPSAAAEALLRRGPEVGLGGERLDVRAVLLFADGALASRGGALLQPYADEPGTSGVTRMSADDIASWGSRALRRGIQVAVAAGGDAGARAAGQGFERALALAAGADARFRVEGLSLFDAGDLATLARLRVTACVRPADLAPAGEGPPEERRVGPERATRLYAFGTLLEAGLPLAGATGSSDRAVSPLEAFAAAVTRQTPDGGPPGGWHPEQRLGRPEALRLFTDGGARALRREASAGSLERGKWADFVVLSQDILTVPAAALARTEVLATYVAGREVYRRERAAGAP